MGKGILAALLGALAMFAWGFVSWTVLHLHEVKGFGNSEAVAKTLQRSGDETGVYWIPASPGTEDKESPEYKKWVEAHEQGPIAMVVYNKDGGPVMDPMTMVKGFLVMLASCLIVATMLASAGIGNYMGRLMFCTSFGLLAAVYVDGSNWAWFFFPMDWTITAAVDHVLSWAIAGAVMAALIKPRAA